MFITHMFSTHKKYRLLLAGCMLILLSMSAYGHADPCRFDNRHITQKFSVNAGRFLVNRDIKVGEVIDAYPIKQMNMDKFHCDGSQRIEWEFTGYSLSAMNASGKIYDSGISGIGIRINDQNNEMKIEFVKTKSATGSGRIKQGVITARLAGTTLYSYSLSEIHFITPTCSLQEKNIRIPMGKIGSSQFSGVNSTAGERHFEIDLACNTHVPIELVLNPIIPGKADDVLGLDQDSHSADGIGLQVLYQDQPVIFNSSVKPGSSMNGIYSVPFKARYIQTAAHITAGKANATATLNIVYP
ncbi:fimbrial adhesin protein precursor [Xenorhabdus beddingii]|uniref:Fimbrial adhesin protein n=1 Tax=Xenorhabdus beddingii TaxID=40578 RepID=A0A1Y2SSL2_9GAMM|nr:fimbrial protein [Xenorhabdus beddingii]OTA21182.1 fimbrial adhesin protein precursor [Xenorhabdus beddingii]